MEKEEIISSGLLEMYAIGATSAEETKQVEQWKIDYPAVAEELYQIEIAMEAYALFNAVQPAVHLKSEILASIDSKNNLKTVATPGKIISISPLWKSMAAAALVLLVGSAVLNLLFYNKYKNANSKYEEGQQQMALQTEKLNELNKDWTLVQSKYSQPVALKGLEAAPDAAAKIFWMKNTGETYIDPSNLPDVPAGMQYQLWAIIDGKPVDAGMITSKVGKKYKIQKMKTFGKVQAFAVTLETTGGNPTPKGKMYVMGEI